MEAGYTLGRKRGYLHHLQFMDDLRVYGKNMKDLDSLIETTRTYSKDIGMEFGISKCAMLEMNAVK